MKRKIFNETISIWMKFGKRLVIWWSIKKSNNIQYLCKCDCWTIAYRPRTFLIKNKKSWCNKCKDRSNYGTHKMSKTKIYKIYTRVLSRCNNKNNPDYKYYWWRWIKCERKTFEEFYIDMSPSYKDGLSIDRINNNWNYSKINCRWADKIMQANNTRQTTVYKYWINKKDLAKKYELSESHIRNLMTKFNYNKELLIEYLENNRLILEKYKGKTCEERARYFWYHSWSWLRQRINRNNWSLWEAVEMFLSWQIKRKILITNTDSWDQRWFLKKN